MIFVAICAVVGGIAGALAGEELSYNYGLKAGMYTVLLLCPALSAVIITKKGLWGDYRAICLFIISIVAAYIMGALLGLVFVTMLYALKIKAGRS